MDAQLRAHLRTASSAYRRFADQAGEADRQRSTRLAGWRIGDLIDHVAWGAAMEAQAVRAAAALSGPEPNRDEPADPAEASTGLKAAVDSFAQMTEVDLPVHASVELAAGTVPMALAAPLFAFEAAVHAWDLDRALDGDSTLRPDEIVACEMVIGPMLDLLGVQGPGDDVVIDLMGLTETIRLRFDAGGAGWNREAPDGLSATTTIWGDPEELVLFVTGRLDVDRLQIEGEPEHASRFKTYFPGP